MALLTHVRKETTGLLAKLGLRNNDMMAANFRLHGAAMGFHDMHDYRAYAIRIFKEAEKNPEGFTVVDLPKGKKAIDFQGKIRGVYDEFGEPLAFFRPEPKAMGYDDPKAELQEFIDSVRFIG